MADTTQRMDDGDAAALARLLDPVALEARLAEARIRRAGVLAAKEAPPEEPVLENLPGLALRGAGVILAGLTVVATIATYIFARPGAAPEAFEITAILEPPAAIAAAPAAAAAPAWQEASLAPPILAGLASGLRPVARPADEAPPATVTATVTAAVTPELVPFVTAATASKARSARAPGFADAAPVLRTANAATFLPMMSRSAELARFPLAPNDTREPVRRAAPKRASQPDGLVGQIARIGQAVVRDISRDVKRTETGKGIVRGVRRAAAALNDDSRSRAHVARPAITKSTRNQLSNFDRRGHGKASIGKSNGKSKAGGNGRGKGGGKGKGGGGKGKGGGKGHRR